MRAAIICTFDKAMGQPAWPVREDGTPLIRSCWAMQPINPQPDLALYGVNEDEAVVSELLTHDGFVLEEVLEDATTES